MSLKGGIGEVPFVVQCLPVPLVPLHMPSSVLPNEVKKLQQAI